ncbi:MAG: hypothetical protein Q7W02_00060 [Candidatus Rokubacteria bacterium]|nr:hypothetical protein [Candidatus Rokubacteria bacterium]
MGKMLFTAADVRDLLALKNTAAVDRLIDAKVLTVAALSARGYPLFDFESVRRAANKVVFVGREEIPSS